jgi:hypothetical protein
MALVRRRRPNAPRFVPLNAKIADITHADTVKHLLVLANGAGTGAIAGETSQIISVTLTSARMAGTGEILLYSNEGARSMTLNPWGMEGTVMIMNGTQRLQYSLSVANDDFDLYCHGYVVKV